MAIIHKKIWPDYFEDVASGKKKFEIRLADFDVAEGDILVLQEWDAKKKRFTGRKIQKTVTYVAKFDLDRYDQKQEILEKGLYVIQL